jgi:hypothetical protein
MSRGPKHDARDDATGLKYRAASAAILALAAAVNFVAIFQNDDPQILGKLLSVLALASAFWLACSQAEENARFRMVLWAVNLIAAAFFGAMYIAIVHYGIAEGSFFPLSLFFLPISSIWYGATYWVPVNYYVMGGAIGPAAAAAVLGLGRLCRGRISFTS